ncbi:MAG TPA: DUF1080 domain-containing protein [Bryobacteraceae bacterium]|nr:DUF1080 domain-containing protein [Bryobacteraceae bacterium]HPT25672.1 DUF1080 domain-containing protein [Bryobacteraceae bacterium]
MPLRVVLAASLLSALAAPFQASGPITLFNGKNLSGWTHYFWNPATKSQDAVTPMSDVWTVKNGILICKGNPTGYIRTVDEYEDYRLEVEWRWPLGTTSGNNGVLVHVTSRNALGQWPKSIEVQLAKDDAGDFWVIGTSIIVADIEKRRQGRRYLNLTDGSEKPVGEWNKMVIEALGDEVKVWVNGDLVNHATDCSQSLGAIALQSEGAIVEFRSVVLTPLR